MFTALRVEYVKGFELMTAKLSSAHQDVNSDDRADDQKDASTAGSAENSSQDVTQWVEEFGDRLYKYALFRVRNKELAEDLVQDALLSAFRSRASFEGRSSVYTWLVTILKNKIIDHVRKDSRASIVSLDDGFQDERGELFNRLGLWKVDLLDWDGGGEALLERQDFRLQFESCLAKMPEKLRQAFIFKVVDDLDSEEVCEILKISPNNLWVMLYRARMRLRTCLDKNWFEKSGGE